MATQLQINLIWKGMPELDNGVQNINNNSTGDRQRAQQSWQTLPTEVQRPSQAERRWEQARPNHLWWPLRITVTCKRSCCKFCNCRISMGAGLCTGIKLWP